MTKNQILLESSDNIQSLEKGNHMLNIILVNQKENINKLKIRLKNIEFEKGKLIQLIHLKENQISQIKNQILIVSNKITSINKPENSELKKSENLNEIIILKREKEKNLNLLNKLKNKEKKLIEELKIINSNFNKSNNSTIQSKSNDEDLFLTNNDELLKLNELNLNLSHNFEKMKFQFEQSINEKNNLIIRLEEVNKEKNNMLTLLNNKNELFSQKETNQSSLSKKLISEGKNNQISKLNLVNIMKKYNNLRYENKDLESLVMKQKNKINELNQELIKYSTISKKKDSEIYNNHSYINKLKESVILNLEYKNSKKQGSIKSNKGIEDLRNELNHLKTIKDRRIHNKINNLDNLNFSFHEKKKYNQKLFDLQGKSKIKKIQVNQSTKNIFPQKLNKNVNLKRKKILIKNHSIININSNLNPIQRPLYNKFNYRKSYDFNLKNNIFNPVDSLQEKKEKQQIEELKTMMNELVKEIS